MVYYYVDHDLMFVYLYMKSVWDFFSFVVCDFVILGIADHGTSVCGQWNDNVYLVPVYLNNDFKGCTWTQTQMRTFFL